MPILVWFLITFIIVGFFDVWAYALAKYPERTRSFLYKLPGGGFVALWKFGRED